MKTSIGVRTDVGRTREVNEDSYLVQDPLFVVADGMGGHVAGDVASRTAIEMFTEKTDERAPTPESLASLVRGANAAVFNKARSDTTLQGMGTTCTVLLLEDTDAHVAHVGDSRAYLFRDGALQQLTEDHTLVQRMVKEGRLDKEDAARHPQRNIITRVLGVDADVSVDTLSVEAQPGDRFLLCSDGLSSMVEDSEIEAVLAQAHDAQRAADELVDLANEAGGEDNITVVVVDVADDSQAAPGGASGTLSSDGHRNSTGTADPSWPHAQSVDTQSEGTSDRPPAAASRARPHWARMALALLLITAILGTAAYIGVRYLWLGHSFFVGVNESHLVTIYRGVPGSVAGVHLQMEEETTNLALSDVPEIYRDDLQAGIHTESLQEARAQVHDLEERAADFRAEQANDAQRGDRNREGNR